MAIKKSDAGRQLTPEDRGDIAVLERLLDEILDLNYVPGSGTFPSFDLSRLETAIAPHSLNHRVIRELVILYEKAGWTVRVERGRESFIQFS